MTSKKSQLTQKTCVDIVNDNPAHFKTDWAILTSQNNQRTIDDWIYKQKKNVNVTFLDMPRYINWNKMKEIYDFNPENYEKLLAINGVGSNTIRSLVLISDLIYGNKPSWEDPVKYCFTVGGKDGVPFPIDIKAMDESTDIIRLIL